MSREISELQGLGTPEARKVAKPEVAPKKARPHCRAYNKVVLADALAVVMKGKKKVTINEAKERRSRRRTSRYTAWGGQSAR